MAAYLWHSTTKCGRATKPFGLDNEMILETERKWHAVGRDTAHAVWPVLYAAFFIRYIFEVLFLKVELIQIIQRQNQSFEGINLHKFELNQNDF